MSESKSSAKNNGPDISWRDKTLEGLENDFWPEPTYESHLVTTCHKLRKKSIGDFSIEELRIMIGQNIGLHYLIPIAIEELENNIVAEGDFYPGDLLYAVLTSERKYWVDHRKNWEKVIDLVNSNQSKLESSKGWRKNLDHFNRIHNEGSA